MLGGKAKEAFGDVRKMLGCMGCFLFSVFIAGLISAMVLFVLPQLIAEKYGILGIYHMIVGDDDKTKAKEKKLLEKYMELTITEEYKGEEHLGPKEPREGYEPPARYHQAFPYRLNWAILAAVDRIIVERREDKPKPEKHFEALRPYFKWRDSTVTVCSKTEDGGCSCTTYKIELITKAEQYDKDLIFHYHWERGECGSSREVLDHIEEIKKEGDNNRLLKLLHSYKLYNDDENVRFINELAKTYGPMDLVQDMIADEGGSSGSVDRPFEWPPGTNVEGKAKAVVDGAYAEMQKNWIRYPVPMTARNISKGLLDCSLFTYYIFNKYAGINIGNTTQGQIDKATKITRKQDLKPGDLVFFHGTYASGYSHGVSHVGIYIGGGKMIHSSSGKGRVVVGNIDWIKTRYGSDAFLWGERWF